MGYSDILGDWREEVWYVAGENELRIYITTIPATTRLYTLMYDSDYRISVACETMGYMQATQPSFYLPVQLEKVTVGQGMPIWQIASVVAVIVSVVSVIAVLKLKRII